MPGLSHLFFLGDQCCECRWKGRPPSVSSLSQGQSYYASLPVLSPPSGETGCGEWRQGVQEKGTPVSWSSKRGRTFGFALAILLFLYTHPLSLKTTTTTKKPHFFLLLFFSESLLIFDDFGDKQHFCGQEPYLPTLQILTTFCSLWSPSILNSIKIIKVRSFHWIGDS